MTTVQILNISAVILTCAAAFGWVNVRWLKLPHTIALVIMALGLSLSLILADRLLGGDLAVYLQNYVSQIHFNETLMIGMLSFLLFAGAMHTDLDLMLKYKWPILAMATLGVALSTAIVGFATHTALFFFGIDIPLAWCFVFGALISPTDPVAVLAIMKKAKLTKSLEIKIAGESLFNDGIGVVAFTLMLAIATSSGEATSFGNIVYLLLSEVAGGLLIGLAGGYIAFAAMRRIDEYSVEVLITLAAVTAIYSICITLHASGPLAVVAAGLLLGNHGTKLAMSEQTREHVLTFWSLLDEILNSVLFLLIGFEVLILGFNFSLLMATLTVIPILLVARLISVFIPLSISSRSKNRARGAIKILSWAGLRGGISIALALSLPYFEGRDAIIVITYGIVLFSIVVQGLTIEKLAIRWAKEGQG